jgi:acyl-coenzyme A thioesterase PaaI-like protein
MPAAAAGNFALALWNRLSPLPFGRWPFSQAVCFKAPYFRSISPRVVELRPGLCRVTVRKRRKVTNHIGTVHAIALCNMAELAAGTMCEATVPATHRWIPKGMTVEYLAKAVSNVTATAAWDPLPDFGAAREIPVVVPVLDMNGATVARATITMWITPRKEA